MSVEQDGPGKYNDDVWEAMDRVLDEARRAGLKVMMSFLDNWKYDGALHIRSSAPVHICNHKLYTELGLKHLPGFWMLFFLDSTVPLSTIISMKSPALYIL